jgi:MoxR-like ATPase
LGLLVRSRHPLVFARHKDEERLLALLRHAASEARVPLWTWSIARGLSRDGQPAQYMTTDCRKALEFVSQAGNAGVFAFLDMQPLLGDAVVVRRIKEIAQAAIPGLTLVVAVQNASVPAELDGLAMSWELSPPSHEERSALVQKTLDDLAARGIPVRLAPEHLSQLSTAVAGLSSREAARVITEAAFRDGSVGADDVVFVRRAKAALVGADGILEMFEPEEGDLSQVGGMDGIKAWLDSRGRAFDPGAVEFGLEAPRGVLLTGVPGCGKSLVAKTLAATWGLPLVLLDPARLYGPYVGETERRLQDALDTVQAMAPCVLWIDEIEKGFSADDRGDGGVSMRVRGTFLRWLQDRPPGVFVVATCNQVSLLPPELARKGRFDEIFFVDLPGAREREEIFALHLARRKRDPAAFDVAALAAASEGFSGSEIEAAVVGAMYRAYAGKKSLDTAHVLEELTATVPLSATRAEEVSALRAWADGRTVRAN